MLSNNLTAISTLRAMLSLLLNIFVRLLTKQNHFIHKTQTKIQANLSIYVHWVYVIEKITGRYFNFRNISKFVWHLELCCVGTMVVKGLYLSMNWCPWMCKDKVWVITCNVELNSIHTLRVCSKPMSEI